MSFADFNDIYRICSNFNDGENSVNKIKLGIDDMTPSSSVTDFHSASSDRWWELAEKEIHQEKRETVHI